MMPKATAPLETSTPRKLKKPDQTTANCGRQRVGVDHGRHRVGGVVEAVDELEAERDQQRDEQQEIGQVGRDLGAGRVDVGIEAVGDEQQSAGEDAEEQDHRQRVEALVEIGAGEGRLDRRRRSLTRGQMQHRSLSWTPINFVEAVMCHEDSI